MKTILTFTLLLLVALTAQALDAPATARAMAAQQHQTGKEQAGSNASRYHCKGQLSMELPNGQVKTIDDEQTTLHVSPESKTISLAAGEKFDHLPYVEEGDYLLGVALFKETGTPHTLWFNQRNGRLYHQVAMLEDGRGSRFIGRCKASR